jgi:polyisoprenoid-binding protein YceI
MKRYTQDDHNKEILMTWQLDKAHSEVGFSVRHMMISTVRGNFAGVEAEVTFNPENLSDSRVEAKIDAETIDTGEAQRDGHLRSADFFDVENHPHIVFKSTNVRVSGTDIEVTGDLTIRETTKSVTLKGEYQGPGKDPWGMMRMGFSLAGEIDREDFGLTWNQALETGGVLVAKKVKMQVEVQLVDKAD